MGTTRRDEWNSSEPVYTPGQVEAVLRALGIDVREETDQVFISFCPYHGNTESPAFATNKITGYSICFNPSCAVGSERENILPLEKMVRDLKHLNHFEAKRFVIKNRDNTSFQDRFDSIKLDQEPQPFPSKAIETMENRFWQSPPAIDYMHGRGFTDDTLRKFHVGFTPASEKPIYKPWDMVVVPAYDHRGTPVGIVARSIEGKEFKNYGPGAKGTGFQKSKIVWNLNNARRSETCIINEATFDGMAVDQAGYPNVAALLGGSLSETQKQLLRRHFNTLIIMTDNENKENGAMNYPINCRKCLKAGFDMCQGHAPGRDLGMKIATEMSDMRIKWAMYDEKNVYANNVKDARAMNDEEISKCLRNSISHFDYLDLVA